MVKLTPLGARAVICVVPFRLADIHADCAYGTNQTVASFATVQVNGTSVRTFPFTSTTVAMSVVSSTPTSVTPFGAIVTLATGGRCTVSDAVPLFVGQRIVGVSTIWADTTAWPSVWAAWTVAPVLDVLVKDAIAALSMDQFSCGVP